MTLARQLLRSGSGMAAAQATCLALTLARNVLLARLLGPEQFGIAVTYAVVMGFVEASFEFGTDKYILQAPDGDRPDVLAAAHTFTVARGLLAGLVIFLAAGPIASLFHVPELAWAYQLLALVPVVHGFVNLEFRARQRHFVYRPEIIILVASNVLGFAAAVIAALFEASHLAMIISVAVQVTVFVVLSFGLAQGRYRLGFGRGELTALFTFGWPLLATSFLIALSQLDRAMVGAAFGPELLAAYAATAILVGGPLQLIGRLLVPIMLPVLGPLRGQARFLDRYEAFGAIIALLVLAVYVPLALLGTWIIPLVFGQTYDADPILVAALAGASGVSLLRAWTNVAALATGHSKATMMTNLVRLSGMLLALAVIALGGSIRDVGLALFLGESAALAFGLMRTHRLNKLPVSTGLGFIGPCFAVLTGAIGLAPVIDGFGWEAAVLTTFAVSGIAMVVVFSSSSSARSVVRAGFAVFRPT